MSDALAPRGDPGRDPTGSGAREPARPLDVWIDTDPAAGIADRDVDDALALIQAFHSPELVVRGVSVVFGNAELADGLPIAHEIVRRFGPSELGVTAGAAGAAMLGVETDASRALAAALAERPLTILALGPLTNVGTVVARRPELRTRIERIVAVAGRRRGQRFFSAPTQREPFPDFNFEHDVDAARTLLASDVPLVLAPWEVSSHLWLTRDDIAALATRSDSGAWIASRTQSWLAFWQREVGVDAFNPFDTLAVAALTHPALVETVDVTVAIEAREASSASGQRREAAVHELVVDLDRGGVRATRYCHRPRPELKDVILERLAARP